MKEAVVVENCRTPLAKSFRGSLNMTRPDDMLAHCLKTMLERVPNLDPKEIEDVVIGCGYPQGSQGTNVARIAAMRAGLPTTAAATTVNRFCSSGLQSTAMAAHEIMHGADVAISGGVESITVTAKFKTDPNPWIEEHMPELYMVMGDTAEVVAKRYNISREAQDEYSVLSQQRTARAQQEGFFEAELAPMHVTRAILDRKTGEVTGTEEHELKTDECNRPDTTLERLAATDFTAAQQTERAPPSSEPRLPYSGSQLWAVRSSSIHFTARFRNPPRRTFAARRDPPCTCN